MDALLPIAGRAGALLKTRGETVAVAESVTGGLVPARCSRCPAPVAASGTPGPAP
jgi:nicotinamide mononucleotide (NMN) deamidase PncC